MTHVKNEFGKKWIALSKIDLKVIKAGTGDDDDDDDRGAGTGGGTLPPPSIS